MEPSLLEGPQFQPLPFDPDDPKSRIVTEVDEGIPPNMSTVIEWSSAFAFPNFSPVVKFGDVFCSCLTTHEDWVREFENRTFRLVVFHNYFVQGWSGFFREGALYLRSAYSWLESGWALGTNASNFFGKYDEVIASSHRSNSDMAHWILDFSSFLVLWPPEILSRAHVVTFQHSVRRFVEETFECFNLSSRVIRLESLGFIFARLVYSIHPLPAECPQPIALTLFRQWIVDRIGLDQRLPFEMVALVKGPGARQRLTNAPDVVALFEDITERTWILTQGPTSILRSAEFFNTVLILFGIQGPANIAVVYMQPRTVFLDVHNSLANLVFWNATRILGMHHITAIIPEIGNRDIALGRTPTLNLSIAERMLRTALALLSGKVMTRGIETYDCL
jgi:hypothetical protein